MKTISVRNLVQSAPRISKLNLYDPIYADVLAGHVHPVLISHRCGPRLSSLRILSRPKMPLTDPLLFMYLRSPYYPPPSLLEVIPDRDHGTAIHQDSSDEISASPHCSP